MLLSIIYDLSVLVRKIICCQFKMFYNHNPQNKKSVVRDKNILYDAALDQMLFCLYTYIQTYISCPPFFFAILSFKMRPLNITIYKYLAAELESCPLMFSLQVDSIGWFFFQVY